MGTENFGTLVISWDLKFIVSDWLIFDLLKIIEIKTKSGFNLKKKIVMWLSFEPIRK